MKTKQLFITTLIAGSVSAAFAGKMAPHTADFVAWNKQQQQAAPAQLEQRFIVKFKDGSTVTAKNGQGQYELNAKAARSFLKSMNVEVRKELGFAKAMSVVMNPKTQQALMNNPAVEYVEPDYPRRLMAQNTPWGITTTQSNSVSDGNASNMKVCIIDSGYDISNPDLAGNNHAGTNNSGTGNWYTPGGSHGTHVAGTIAAVNNSEGVVGVLPNQNVNIHVVKVFNESGWGYSSDLASAINTCANNGAKVVNMSLGGAGSSTTERNALQSIYNNGVLLIAASGNDGNTTMSYPASYDSVVAVGALDENKQWAEFSQYTSQVELSAPGEAILSTVGVGDGAQGYITVGGTTFGDDRALPLMRFVPVSGSYQLQYFNGTATGTLGACSVSGSGSYTCNSMSNKICLVERFENQSGSNYPESNPVQACRDAGAKAAIVYSNSDRPGLQNPFLVDANTAFNFPTLSVNRAVGQALLASVGQSTTVESRTGTDYAYYNGTSMATPHVTGVAALVWSQFPQCTAAQIRNVLNVTAEDLGSAGRDTKYGFGMVNAQDAVDYLSANGCDGNGGGTTPPPTPGDGELVNGQSETSLSGATGEEIHYTLVVPAGATNLSFAMNGGSGDADLYVKFGSKPTTSSYDCRPYRNGNTETCDISNVQAGTYYVMLRGYSAFSGVSLVANFDEPSSGGGAVGGSASLDNLSGSRRAWDHYTVEIPAGMSSLSVVMSGGSGDADLYVNFGSQPTTSSYDCRPYKNGNSEVCTFTNPSAGTWHLSIYGYSAYSGVSLDVEWNP
ncbi:S8 family serine peptidase [Pleionea litopenaei]|uniref:S8 family serine peptidase n=1 Tax=Pleionea litopenaei TaxID=3070815 RepID=A0AA51X5S8_9GAMM|nr:S8 family serine peptidase [Pleionea sp. HL-JVS1]WMS86021.1 S8 family serine peptidase [Pleionea sp. HL-JVS1]